MNCILKAKKVSFPLFENMFSREMEGKITLLSNKGGESEIVDSTNFE